MCKLYIHSWTHEGNTWQIARSMAHVEAMITNYVSADLLESNGERETNACCSLSRNARNIFGAVGDLDI